MTDKSSSARGVKTATLREDRLKAALKANLARRKAQGRLRAEGSQADDHTPDDAGQEKDR